MPFITTEAVFETKKIPKRGTLYLIDLCQIAAVDSAGKMPGGRHTANAAGAGTALGPGDLDRRGHSHPQ